MPQISSGKLKGVMTLQLLTLLRCDAINVECDLIALMQDLSEVMALTPPNLSGVGFGAWQDHSTAVYGWGSLGMG